MKKVMMMAMMAVAASSTFAQEDLVKAAKKLADKDYAKALETIKPALTSEQTTDKAAAWAVLTDIEYKNYARISEAAAKSQITHEAYDTLGMHRSAVAALEAAYKCDEFDMQPNEKGKIKPKYRSSHQNQLKTIGGAIVNAGLYEYNARRLDEAQKDWILYLDMASAPLFKDVKDMPQDAFRDDILYYTAFVSYQKKDYANAVKYAKLGMQSANEETKKNCQEIFDNSKTQELVQAYEAKNGDPAAQKKVIEDALAKDPNDDFAWALKGQDEMNASKWDDALKSFDKAISINPKFVQCYYNAGVCLNSKARELDDQLADKTTGRITPENLEKVKAVLNQSLGYLEKCKELDPERKAVNWAYPLYQIYYSLQNTEKAAEMEKLLKN